MTSQPTAKAASDSHLILRLLSRIFLWGTAPNITDYDCCNERLRLQPKCFNIDVKGDQFYGSINRTCMDFSRSNFHCNGGGSHDDGNSDWIEQFNEATSFLDGSQVYGSTKSLQMALRHKSDGLLATNHRLTDFLPTRGDLGMTLGYFYNLHCIELFAGLCAKMLDRIEPIYNYVVVQISCGGELPVCRQL